MLLLALTASVTLGRIPDREERRAVALVLSGGTTTAPMSLWFMVMWRWHQIDARLRELAERDRAGPPGTAIAPHAAAGRGRARGALDPGRGRHLLRERRALHPRGDPYAEALLRTPLKELLLGLDEQQLWQVHRSIIVNHRHIAAAVRVDDGNMHLTLRHRSEKLPVSRHFQGLFKGQ